MAELIATWSKDQSRQCGAVIVDSRNAVLSLGWNGFPRGINDHLEERQERPAKYLWMEHAERNAIYNAASNGIQLKGSTIYVTWMPCADCTRAIIQSGISTIIVKGEIDYGNPIWGSQFAASAQMISECGLHIKHI